MKLNIKILLVSLILSGCIGPEYKKPEIKAPEHYKESNIAWVEAKPSADIDRGHWWKIFNDPILDDLIAKLNVDNQNIASYAALYLQSEAEVEKTRSAWFPSLGYSYASTSQKTNEQSTPQQKVDRDTTSHSGTLSSTWELDVWGSTKYSVESDKAAARSNKAYLASQILSLQSSLAQYYFELRALDADQHLYDEIVFANKKIVQYTKHKHKAGTAELSDILSAESNLYNAEANAANNKINRQQYVHAIAVLIGVSPSEFSIAPVKNYQLKSVSIPVSIPSQLLERRPDIAQYEELVKQANAQIGVAKTAFFPSISFDANYMMQGNKNTMGNLLNMPVYTWSLGPQLALGIFDGGYKWGQIKYTKAAYKSAVANYKQTVLSAFQEVEDQLSAINSLREQVKALTKSTQNSERMLKITENQYRSGIVDYSQILNNKISYYNAKVNLINTISLKRTAEITLIKALGGGWKNDLEN